MAFFRHEDGSTYFGLFNSCDGIQEFSGGFYQLEEYSAAILFRIYVFSALYAMVAFPVELTLCAIASRMSVEWNEIACSFFFIADALAIVPAAAYVAVKPRKVLERCSLRVDLRASLPVYATVILLPICYGISLVWAMRFGAGLPHLALWLLLLSLISGAAFFRFLALKKLRINT